MRNYNETLVIVRTGVSIIIDASRFNYNELLLLAREAAQAGGTMTIQNSQKLGYNEAFNIARAGKANVVLDETSR